MFRILVLVFIFHQIMALMDLDEFNKNIVKDCFEKGMPIKSHEGVSVDNFIYMVESYEKKHPEAGIENVILTFLNEFNCDGLVIPLPTSPFSSTHFGKREDYAINRLDIVERFLEGKDKHVFLKDQEFPTDRKCHLFFTLSHAIYKTQISPSKRIPDESVTTEKITTTLPSDESNPKQTDSQNVTVEQGVASFKGDKIRAIALGEVLYGILGALVNKPKELKNLGIINSDYGKEKLESSYAFSLAAIIAAKGIYDEEKKSEIISRKNNKWNSAYCTKEYILEEENKIFTEANLLGALDGFIMGKKIRENNDKSFKLSQLLRMYYSHQGFSINLSKTTTSFCERKIILEDGEFKTEIKEQVRNYIIYDNLKRKQPINEITIEKISLAEESFFKYAKYFTDFTDVEKDLCEDKKDVCETPSNIVVVLDERNHLNEQKTTIAKLINKLNIEKDESNIMILSNSVEGHSNTNLKTIQDTTNNKVKASCSISEYYNENYNDIDDGSVLEAINQTLMNIEQEKISLPGVPSKVVLYYNFGPPIENAQSIRKIENARRELINKHRAAVIIGIGENEKHLERFIKDPGLNFVDFRITDIVDHLEEKVCSVPAEFQYQDCTKRSKDETKHLLHVNPDGVQYWTMQPKYFYKSFGYKLKFKPENGNIRVCFNRKPVFEKSQPGCQQTNNDKQEIEFSERDPCKGFTAVSCSPFYFAIYGIDDNLSNRAPCVSEPDEQSPDKPVCKTLNQLKVTFTHEGLACSSALRQISSLYQLFIAFFIVLYIANRKS